MARGKTIDAEQFSRLRMRKRLTMLVDGPYGPAESRMLWMTEKEVIFWCREELRLGTRPIGRVDIGTTEKQVDCSLLIEQHLLPDVTGIKKGFVFAGTYKVVNADDEQRLLKGLRRINPEAVKSSSSSAPRQPGPPARGDQSGSMDSSDFTSAFDSTSHASGESGEMLLWKLNQRRMARARGKAGKPRQRQSTIDTMPVDRPKPSGLLRQYTKQGMGPVSVGSPDSAAAPPQIPPGAKAPYAPDARSGRAPLTRQDTAATLRRTQKNLKTSTGLLKQRAAESGDHGRKPTAKQRLKQSADALKQRATDSFELTDAETSQDVGARRQDLVTSSGTASGSVSKGFVRSYGQPKKSRRKRRRKKAGSVKPPRQFLPATFASGNPPTVMVPLTEPGQVLACLQKKREQIRVTVAPLEGLYFKAEVTVLLQLPDATLLQFVGRVEQAAQTHTVLEIVEAGVEELEILREALDLI